MPTADHSDHLTGPQSAALVLPIAELFAADLFPPRVPQSRSLARVTQRRLDELAVDSQLAHTTGQTRAFLAANAMGNVATLSVLAEPRYQIAPAGATYYHAILRAYGIKAARGIAQFWADDDRSRHSSTTEQPRTPPGRTHSTISWIISGLAFVGCLMPIAIVLLTWTVWYDDTSSTATTRAQTDAQQQAIATKQARDLAAFYSAMAITRQAQEAAAELEKVTNGKDESGGANSSC